MTESDDEDQPDRLGTPALFDLAYEELRRLAAGARFAPQGPTLQPTAILHEAYMKLSSAERRWESREHFVAVAARAMRQVLQDHARSGGRVKRTPGGCRVTLAEVGEGRDYDALDLIAIDEAMRLLEGVDADAAALAELRIFGGLTSEEAARALDISVRKAQLDWRSARTWLERKLGDDA